MKKKRFTDEQIARESPCQPQREHSTATAPCAPESPSVDAP